MRLEARQHGNSRRHTHRRRAVRRVEDHPRPGEPIEGWGLEVTRAGVADLVVTLLVRDDEDEIRAGHGSATFSNTNWPLRRATSWTDGRCANSSTARFTPPSHHPPSA